MDDYSALRFLLIGAGLVLFVVITLAPLKLFSIHRELQRQTDLLDRIAQRLDAESREL